MTRDAILGAIRRGLKRGPLPADQRAMLEGRLRAHPRHIVPARSRVPRPEQIALFVRNVEREFGTVERVPDASAVPAAVADYLAAQNAAPRFVMAPHPELLALPWSDRPLLRFEARRAEDGDMVSVQHAWAAVAETGTILFPSDPTRPATLNLLPDFAVAVLRASRIVGAFEEAWDLLRAERGGAEFPPGEPGSGFMPRNLMLVTGPSRSADIEQTLELGAHGPRRLHVVLVDDDPEASPFTAAADTASRPDPRPPAARGPITPLGRPDAAAPGD